MTTYHAEITETASAGHERLCDFESFSTLAAALDYCHTYSADGSSPVTMQDLTDFEHRISATKNRGIVGPMFFTLTHSDGVEYLCAITAVPTSPTT